MTKSLPAERDILPDVAGCPVCEGRSTTVFKSLWPVPLRRCDQCDVRFVWPVPTPNELRQRYDREHGEGKWDELLNRGDPAEPRRRVALLTRLASTRRRLLLDVGFGDGTFLDQAADMGWQAIGLEVSVEAAVKVAPTHRVVVGTLESVALDPAPVDVVTFWDVLEHLPNPGAVVKQAAVRLPEGGLVAATMPSAASFTARIERGRWRYYDLGTYGHLVHLSPHHLRRLFEQAGLEVIYTETTGSVDLRHSVGTSSAKGIRGTVLDKLSGVLARLAPVMKRGNTLLMVGRRPQPKGPAR